jgi:hypothetical protein
MKHWSSTGGAFSYSFPKYKLSHFIKGFYLSYDALGSCPKVFDPEVYKSNNYTENIK